ncbi:hypothetical protein C9974_09940, partial [Marinobacter sp. B9-2]
EWVAGFVWNQWQPWSGIRTMMHPTLIVHAMMARVSAVAMVSLITIFMRVVVLHSLRGASIRLASVRAR